MYLLEGQFLSQNLFASLKANWSALYFQLYWSYAVEKLFVGNGFKNFNNDWLSRRFTVFRQYWQQLC